MAITPSAGSTPSAAGPTPENARLRADLAERDRLLEEARDRETATSDILKVIASSPTEVQGVLEAIAQRASRLVRVGSANAAVFLVEGDRLRGRAVARGGDLGPLTPRAAGSAVQSILDGLPLAASAPSTRAVAERRVIHIPDIEAEADAYPYGLRLAREAGWRSVLSVPLLRAGVAVGAIGINHSEPGPFTEQEIRLVQSFADQAVIAIENTRLFTELQERLEEQTVTAEVLRVISESPTDLQTVLDTIVQSAMRVCGANDVIVRRLERDQIVRV